MPQCQAINCTNKSEKSFFQIPDPLRSFDHRKLCKKWIEHLHNGKLNIETFKAHRSKVVCEDHFSEDCFEGTFASPVASALKFTHRRKSIKFGSVPTIVNVGKAPCTDTVKTRSSTESIRVKRRNARLKEELKTLRHTTCTTKPVSSMEPHASTVVNRIPEMPVSEQFQNCQVGSCVIGGSLSVSSCQSTDGLFGSELLDVPEPMELEPMYTAVKLDSCPETVTCEISQTGVAIAENLEGAHNYSPGLVLNSNQNSAETVNNSIEDVNSNFNSCGHPCVYCAKVSDVVATDHSYSAKYSVSVGTQTDELNDMNEDTELETLHVPLNRAIWFSTPKKKDEKVTQLIVPHISCSVNETDETELIDLSALSESFRDDSKDLTFTCDSESETDSETDDTEFEKSVVTENKYIVFESALQQLFLGLKCPQPQCKCPIDPDDIKRNIVDGSLLSCDISCTGGHSVMKWNSQPLLGKMPACNLLCSASTLFCGQTYTHIAEFANFMNLKFMSDTTFHRIQREQVMPVVLDTWSLIQSELLQMVRQSGRPLRVSGDGRCDSPGYNAKYCTYSIMDLETSAVLTFVVVQVTETGSSGRMEAEGFRRCMNFLLDEGFEIQVMATDRHVTIRSIMNKEFKETNHQFDVWHLAKNVKKKLSAKAKLKGAEDLNPWIKAVTNHLWWCASNCDGDKDWLEESWISIVHHVVNEHSFEGDRVTKCHHDPLDREVTLKKKWLKKGSRAHTSLKEVVLDKRLRKDIRQLSEFCHTGNLEVYHSLMTKYCPKRQEFDVDQMNTRTALAVIDHNMSRNREHKTNSSGEKVYRSVFSKITGDWTVKPVYKEKGYQWIKPLMEKVVSQKQHKILPATSLKKKGNIAPFPAPPKSELVNRLKSRFLK